MVGSDVSGEGVGLGVDSCVGSGVVSLVVVSVEGVGSSVLGSGVSGDGVGLGVDSGVLVHEWIHMQ